MNSTKKRTTITNIQKAVSVWINNRRRPTTVELLFICEFVYFTFNKLVDSHQVDYYISKHHWLWWTFKPFFSLHLHSSCRNFDGKSVPLSLSSFVVFFFCVLLLMFSASCLIFFWYNHFITSPKKFKGQVKRETWFASTFNTCTNT